MIIQYKRNEYLQIMDRTLDLLHIKCDRSTLEQHLLLFFLGVLPREYREVLVVVLPAPLGLLPQLFHLCLVLPHLALDGREGVVVAYLDVPAADNLGGQD